jgi:hypothetical protein
MPLFPIPRENPVHTREKFSKRHQGRRAKEIKRSLRIGGLQSSQNRKRLDQITQPS